jgi:hypothetical protein
LAEADAALAENPGQLLMVAFALAMRAMVAPTPDIEAPAWRLSEGPDTPPFVWTVLSFVLARLHRRQSALDIIDASLLCSRTTPGEATLYAAPLAALGEFDRAAGLLQRAARPGPRRLAAAAPGGPGAAARRVRERTRQLTVSLPAPASSTTFAFTSLAGVAVNE